MQQGEQTYTVVEYPTCYVVVDQATGEEVVVSKEEPRPLLAVGGERVRLQGRA